MITCPTCRTPMEVVGRDEADNLDWCPQCGTLRRIRVEVVCDNRGTGVTEFEDVRVPATQEVVYLG